MAHYIFQSQRLGFRNWSLDDLDEFTEMNSDPGVMAHFPSTLNRVQSEALMQRMIKSYADNGYTYFAVETLVSGELIGFIGLAYQDYESEVTPAVDIGWRLKKSAWGCGYATEGAKRCLRYAFEHLNIERVISTCTNGNLKSEKVMKKIGMSYFKDFYHPKLMDHPDLQPCKSYHIMYASFKPSN